MSTFNSSTLERRYDCKVYDSSNELICIIHYKENLDGESASVDIYNKGKLPVYMEIGNCSETSILEFLKERVTPPNRMGLEEYLRPLGISPYDYISRIKLNMGRNYDDDYYIVVEDK